MRRVTLITTGGTIEKTYDDSTGELTNRGSVVGRMIRRLRLEDTSVSIVELMSKDSLHLTDDDRKRIAEVVHALGVCGDAPASGVVILHGTDTLDRTGEHLNTSLTNLRAPIILTGAMRPFEMTRSDALQNLTEAIFAAGVLPPGVYAVAHGQVLKFPGVKKDRARMTFVRDKSAK